MAQNLPLSHLTIIDLSRVLAGPYATMVLADLGARVIKVEHPNGGDDSRAYGPFSPTGKSAYFTSINRGKESIALDLKNASDCSTFEALLATADVLVENFRPSVMEKLGYSWEVLKQKYPKLIYATTTGFGHTGPYRERPAYDIIVQGMGGIMSVTGHEGTPPTRVGTSVGDITAGLFTVIGIQAALTERARTGLGSFVDIAMLDCQIAILENAIARYAVTGVSPGPLGAHHASITPFGAFKTADNYIMIAAGNDSLWEKLCDVTGMRSAPEYASNNSRANNLMALSVILETALSTHPTSYWVEKLIEAGVPCGPINTIGDALADPQVKARNMVGETHYEDGSSLLIAGSPIKISGFQDQPLKRAAPALGGDGDAIRRRIEPELVRFANRLADCSGAIIKRYFRAFPDVKTKADRSPVTEADCTVETALRAIIESNYNGHGIIGEEFGSLREDAEYVWVLDPIDGTRSFVAGRPIFGTLIALLHKGKPVLGVIDQPIVGDRWIGCTDYPTRLNRALAKTRTCASVAMASIASSGPNYFNAADLAAYETVRTKAATSLWGGDCYNYGLLASGHIDVVIEAGLKLHDFAALVPVVENAGGVMCDWQGQPLNAQSSGHIVAVGDATLLSEILALLGAH